MSQTLRFKAPVRVGDTVIARVTSKTVDLEKRRVTFDCQCKVGDTTVIDGEALIMVPSKKKKSAN
jgi:3-hydroxybutyryl-CoA dehydratase